MLTVYSSSSDGNNTESNSITGKPGVQMQTKLSMPAAAKEAGLPEHAAVDLKAGASEAMRPRIKGLLYQTGYCKTLGNNRQELQYTLG